jgi:hypothetical protein
MDGGQSSNERKAGAASAARYPALHHIPLTLMHATARERGLHRYLIGDVLLLILAPNSVFLDRLAEILSDRPAELAGLGADTS